MRLIHKTDMAIEALKPANTTGTRTRELPGTPKEHSWLSRPGTVDELNFDHEDDSCGYPISGDQITLKGQDR